VTVSFTSRFPAAYKARIRKTAQSLGDAFGLDAWECLFTLRCPRRRAAQMSAVPESHYVRIDINRDRLASPALVWDLAHELWHVTIYDTGLAIQELPVRYRAPLLKTFEREHDHQSRVLAKLIFGDGCGG